MLLAGGLGTRMREETEFRPKPMVEIGGRPVLWHIMKIFSQFGLKDFVVCVGYKGDQIKDYFANYGAKSMDFTVELGNRESMTFHGTHDEHDWKVTVVDTGPETPTGGRILKVKEFLGGEDFFCTYGDGIAPVNLSELLEFHQESRGASTMTVAKPRSRYGVVEFDDLGMVKSFREKPQGRDWVSIGYFIFRDSIFDFLREDVALEESPLRSLAKTGNLRAFRHEGFWQPMDTVSELMLLNGLWSSGEAPWRTW